MVEVVSAGLPQLNGELAPAAAGAGDGEAGLLPKRDDVVGFAPGVVGAFEAPKIPPPPNLNPPAVPLSAGLVGVLAPAPKIPPPPKLVAGGFAPKIPPPPRAFVGLVAPVVPAAGVPKAVVPDVFPPPNENPVEGAAVGAFGVDDPNKDGVDVVLPAPKAFVPAAPVLDVVPNSPPLAPPAVPVPNVGVVVDEPKRLELPAAGAPKGFAAGVEVCAGCPNPENGVVEDVPAVLFAFDAF